MAIQPGNLPELSAGTLFCGGGLLGQVQRKMHHCKGPTTCGWVTGYSFVIPYYERRAAKLLCLRPNCDCHTLYWIMWKEGEWTFLLSLKDERAGNAKVAVLWGPVCRGQMKTCIVCMIHMPQCISAQQGLRWGRFAWNARGGRDKAFVFSSARNTW